MPLFFRGHSVVWCYAR